MRKFLINFYMMIPLFKSIKLTKKTNTHIQKLLIKKSSIYNKKKKTKQKLEGFRFYVKTTKNYYLRCIYCYCICNLKLR